MQQQQQQLSPSGSWWPQPERDSSAPSDVAKKEGKNSAASAPARQLYSCPYGKLVGVEVREISPEKGKGLFATRAFRPGDVVFEELPFVATPLELVSEDEEKCCGDHGQAKLASSIGWTCEECIKAVGLSIWDSADISLRAHPHQHHEESTPPFNGDIVRVQIKSQYRGERYRMHNTMTLLMC